MSVDDRIAAAAAAAAAGVGVGIAAASSTSREARPLAKSCIKLFSFGGVGSLGVRK